MAKKSIFQKLGMVKENENINYGNDELENLTWDDDTLEDTYIPEDMNVEGLVEIEEVYEKYNLIDQTKSIFKVDEFSKTLPDSLPTDVKRQSVMGILQASGLVVTDLLDDSNERIDALKGVLLAFSGETDDIINSNNEEITKLETKIDELKRTQRFQEMYDSMDELKRPKSVDKLLGNVRESVKENRQKSVGARALHNNKLSTKVSRAENKAQQSKTNDYADELLKKYKK
ncbi:MAG: hypothetical protein ACOCP8_03105 [archaeon]